MPGICQDRVVIITGAGGGLGAAHARVFAAEGACVVVNDINEDAARSVVREIEAMGGKAVANFGSVSNPDHAQEMVQQALDSFGQLDAVVNNAGILRDRIFHKMSLDEWHDVINVHLNGSFYVSRFAADHFRERETGAAVAVSIER